MKFEVTDQEPGLFEEGLVRLTIITDRISALQIIRDIV